MATERLPMRKIREILRLKWVAQRSHREAARSLGVSAGAVAAAVSRARARGLTWAAVEALSDDALERLLYGPPAGGGRRRAGRSRTWRGCTRSCGGPGVTLELLHVEYLARTRRATATRRSATAIAPGAPGSGSRCARCTRPARRSSSTTRARGPTIVDAATGEVIAVELFVAVLGASNYTYAEATRTQQSADWIASHIHAVEYFGGVPAVWVPDQLRTGRHGARAATSPACSGPTPSGPQHYHTVVIPARPAKPRDKAKVEVAVQVAERWILARLRHETFFTLAALNARIRELLTELNARPMKGYGGRLAARALRAVTIGPALQPLPAERFVYADWLKARVNIDYHVEVDRHYYSVPYPLIHEHVDVRLSATTVEIFQRGQRVWLPCAELSCRAGTRPWPSTCRRRIARTWSGVRRGSSAGAPRSAPATEALVQQILASRPHPEQGYRSCLGLLRLAKRTARRGSRPRAPARVAAGARSYRHVDAILKHGLDRQPLLLDAADVPPRADPRQRPRPAYYHEGEPS